MLPPLALSLEVLAWSRNQVALHLDPHTRTCFHAEFWGEGMGGVFFSAADEFHVELYKRDLLARIDPGGEPLELFHRHVPSPASLCSMVRLRERA